MIQGFEKCRLYKNIGLWTTIRLSRGRFGEQAPGGPLWCPDDDLVSEPIIKGPIISIVHTSFEDQEPMLAYVTVDQAVMIKVVHVSSRHAKILIDQFRSVKYLE